jgi:exodeoxyribonuclease VII small subunit
MSDAQESARGSETAGFEEALARLEAITSALEEGQIPLAEALARYEEGVKLLKQCYLTLANAERRIELLNRVDPEGRAHSEPFDDSALSLEAKAESRARRRSRGAETGAVPPDGGKNEIDESGRLF